MYQQWDLWMALLVLDDSLLLFSLLKISFTRLSVTSFIKDWCCHLMLCLNIIEPNLDIKGRLSRWFAQYHNKLDKKTWCSQLLSVVLGFSGSATWASSTRFEDLDELKCSLQRRKIHLALRHFFGRHVPDGSSKLNLPLTHLTLTILRSVLTTLA